MGKKTPEASNEENINAEFKKDRIKTQVLTNAANIIDNADGQMLSALYTPIQSTLGFSLTKLGAITTARALLQSVSTPVWGWFSDKFSRKFILSLGCFIWGIFTVTLGFLSNFWGLLFIRALTGLGLAVIVPTAQSLIADYFHESKRGKAFGMLGLTGVLGAVFGTLYATIIGEYSLFGFEGWRIAFISVGGLSILLGVFVVLFGKDPIRGSSESEIKNLVDKKTEERYSIQIADIKKIITNKTFVLIVFQGVMGLIPWNSIMFVIYWFEHIGFQSGLAGIAFAVIAIGAALGNLFGGFLGDKAAEWKPDKGRILVAQISVFSGIPMMFVIFLAIPREATTLSLVLFILVGFFTGFLISWCAPAANNPIFSELFEPEIRSTAFAIDRLFEGSVAATGTLIVALLAEYAFGYTPFPQGGSPMDLPNPVRLANIDAIAYALIIATCVPWFLCFIIYTFAYFTYPDDRKRIKEIIKARKTELLALSDLDDQEETFKEKAKEKQREEEY
ncbi:MAG: MFS transporter [Asgard group archaeon]|nr:MFS transporter [Asgard group archaeon]